MAYPVFVKLCVFVYTCIAIDLYLIPVLSVQTIWNVWTIHTELKWEEEVQGIFLPLLFFMLCIFMTFDLILVSLHCFFFFWLFIQKYFKAYRKVASKKNTYIRFTQIYLVCYPSCFIFFIFCERYCKYIYIFLIYWRVSCMHHVCLFYYPFLHKRRATVYAFCTWFT